MYTGFYQLARKPFQLSPDSSFYFGSSGHRRAMSYLRYGLSQGEGFIVITGGIGTGKTTLAQNLFSELDSEQVVAARLVTTQVEADDLLRLVVGAFGIGHEGASKAELIRRLENFLADNARGGRRALLVVDEAQNLPITSLEELRMLSNFQISDKPLLQSFLLGQNEFRATLQSARLEQLRQRIIASCHLRPLEQEEIRAYVEHRLRVAGWQGDPRFDDGSFEVINSVSEGIPRKINVLCDRLMLFGYLENLHVLTASHVSEAGRELADELGPVGGPAAGGRGHRDTGLRAGGVTELPRPAATAVNDNPGNSERTDDDELGQRVHELEESVKFLRKGYLQLARVFNRSRA